MLNQFLHGAVMTGYLLAGLLFLRFWKKTKDRLFAMFASAFWVLAVERAFLASTRPEDEVRPYIYVVRLIAFALIIAAIVDKNRVKSP